MRSRLRIAEQEFRAALREIEGQNSMPAVPRLAFLWPQQVLEGAAGAAQEEHEEVVKQQQNTIDDEPHADSLDGNDPHGDSLDGHEPHADSLDGHEPHADSLDGNDPHADLMDGHEAHADSLDGHEPHADSLDGYAGEYKPGSAMDASELDAPQSERDGDERNSGEEGARAASPADSLLSTSTLTSSTMSVVSAVSAPLEREPSDRSEYPSDSAASAERTPEMRRSTFGNRDAYSTSRKALLVIRSSLAMELVWARQAVQSRKQVRTTLAPPTTHIHTHRSALSAPAVSAFEA